MPSQSQRKKRSNFRRFFFRGLAILLPSILTIWILMAAYGFVQQKIAQPINTGVRESILWVSPWPTVLAERVEDHKKVIRADNQRLAAWEAAGGESNPLWAKRDARRAVLEQWWNKNSVLLDLIGLMIAVVAIYIVGAFLGSLIGRKLVSRGEGVLKKVPLIGQVYPSVKQVTDFLVGSDDKPIRFSRVVAVEYPRKGLWSIGLVTGDTMRTIAENTGGDCITVFVPSSPTPFTGYVVTVPRSDTIVLPVTIEEALRFTVSGGVIVPATQQVGRKVAVDEVAVDGIADKAVTSGPDEPPAS